jgi:hypothetical protein
LGELSHIKMYDGDGYDKVCIMSKYSSIFCTEK